MKRFIIKRKADGKFLKRTSSFGNRKTNSWVNSADECTLITTASAATCVMNTFSHAAGWPTDCGKKVRYSKFNVFRNFPFEVVEVGVLLYPSNSQPFMTGVFNGSR